MIKKNMTSQCLAFALGACALTSSSLNAETLAAWDFSSNLNATTEATNITGSAVTFGNFSNASTSYYGRSGGGEDLYARAFEISQTNGDGRILGTTEAVSVESRKTYFEFTLTPDSGAFDLSNFTATINAQTVSDTDAQTGFTAYYFLRSSADDYASNLGTGEVSVTATTASAGKTSADVIFSADLSDFDNISSAVTFRLYTYAVGDGGETLNYNHIARADDFTITGTTAIPEPSHTAAMLGAGALMSMLMIRRRIKA
ncbi:PEP-CTERM sorting domain-containing protein [Coraliomargarita algicola]|uniref:PEP-CTERM sorting domain-containing protein n=1 Tax=Coraliomargarita algicola TaxID=3092156 RepID=A0ABZ0RLX4_9BACT|nr:PEP-CTERM sorting domain-containing protein [Coraliomargarita sp. J2-16]WPJ97097.1 PEP-CTERM sorting domain-containing protein [Coraliomargarita sp. J2-16]